MKPMVRMRKKHRNTQKEKKEMEWSTLAKGNRKISSRSKIRNRIATR
jgi:hypothetical protein